MTSREFICPICEKVFEKPPKGKGTIWCADCTTPIDYENGKVVGSKDLYKSRIFGKIFLVGLRK